MTPSIRKTPIAMALGMASLIGCATTQVLPRELVDARECYNRAVAGPGAELAPAQLHMAHTALERAEAAYKNDPESQEARDLAYVAQRKGEYAESIAGSELARKQKDAAEVAVTGAHEQASQQAQKDLAKAREQLAKAQMETKDALTKLSGLKDAIKEDARGLVITLSSNVMFSSNKAALLPSARKQLDEIARALVGAKTQHIVIEGHSDSTGSAELNSKLSQERAQSVVDYLAQKGISADHMRAEGKGPNSPVADNKTAEGRATNRRVEIVVQGEAKAQN